MSPSPPRGTATRSAQLLAATGAGVLLAACGSSSGTSTTPAAVASSPSAAPPGTAVTVVENEFRIALSRQTFSPGAYTFTARNTGAFPHALMIVGPGVASASTAQLAPGASGSVSVTLRPGRYDVSCPVDHHKSKGMDLTITVGSGTGTASSSPSSAAGSSY